MTCQSTVQHANQQTLATPARLTEGVVTNITDSVRLSPLIFFSENSITCTKRGGVVSIQRETRLENCSSVGGQAVCENCQAPLLVLL